MRPRILVGVIVLMIVAAACGDGTTTTTTIPAEPAAEATTTTEAATTTAAVTTSSPTTTQSIASTTIPEGTTTTAADRSQLSTDWKVTLRGIGPIRAGMTLEEAERAAGTDLVNEGPPPVGEHDFCHYVAPADGPDGIDFMMIDGLVERIDIRSSEFETLSGARIGDTEDEILAMYPGQIEVTGHEYREGGHYLVFVPEDAEDAGYRVLFETDGAVVTEFRAGRVPAVLFTEGCS